MERKFNPECLPLKPEKSSVRKMEYHTERIVTLKCDPSFLVAIMFAGTFFVLGCYYLG